MDIQTLFDAAAQDYDRTRSQYIPCFDEFYGTVLELIPYDSQDPIKVLDLGAGTGLLSALVVGAFPNAALTLADVSPAMLGKARARFAANPSIEYLLVDFVAEPLVGEYEALAQIDIGGELKVVPESTSAEGKSPRILWRLNWIMP